MNYAISIISIFFLANCAFAQSPFNIQVSNAKVDQVLQGNYDPELYRSANLAGTPSDLACYINSEVSADSLKNLLFNLIEFHNRNTYSDTSSAFTGIGAARRWAFSEFNHISQQNQNRLQVSYLDFEMSIAAQCGAGFFKNVFAVLPGTDTAHLDPLVLMAHMDSRCEDVCGLSCFAPGADDNGSGTVLVMELARVLSKYSFQRSIVFLLTVGEEQGLFGAQAFAQYAFDNSISIRAVQNNDVVGGITCGKTASPPGCTAENDMDSTSIRIFSRGINNSQHKSYARFLKTMYQEWLNPIVTVPSQIRLMDPEDRTGRGGDHIPFRQRAFTAIRITEANEHGHGDPSSPGYDDRQHTTNDIIGEDTDSNLIIDNFFVDFNYLSRNTVINGLAAVIAAQGPEIPILNIVNTGSEILASVNSHPGDMKLRIGIRSGTNDFSAFYETEDSSFSVPNLSAAQSYWLSAALVDTNGFMGLFSQEQSVSPSFSTALVSDTINWSNFECSTSTSISLYQGKSQNSEFIIVPNPVSSQATISLRNDISKRLGEVEIKVIDLTGRVWLRISQDISNSKVVSINIEGIPNGIYMLIMRSESSLYGMSKFVKSSDL